MSLAEFCDFQAATTLKCAGWPTYRSATFPIIRPGDFLASVRGGATQMSRRLILVPEPLNGRLILTLSVLAAVMVILAILDASPALALSETPDNTYMTNGKVYASALSGDGGRLYIGGEFTEVRQRSGVGRKVSNLAAINVQTGAAISTWRPKVSGNDAVVRSLAVKDGKVFIGGNFTAVEGKRGRTWPRSARTPRLWCCRLSRRRWGATPPTYSHSKQATANSTLAEDSLKSMERRARIWRRSASRPERSIAIGNQRRGLRR